MSPRTGSVTEGARAGMQCAVPAAEHSFVETTEDGPRTQLWKLHAAECPEMHPHRIARLGVDDCAAPYRRVRMQPEGSFFLACIQGGGRILLDGRWQSVRPGDVCMAPPRVLNAFYAVPGKRWTFAWVRYEEPGWVKPLVGAASPLRTTGGTELARAIEGLRAEWSGKREPQFVHHWLSLVHGLAGRLASPWHSDDRLWRLWEAVSRDLAAPWTLVTLAERAHMSAEHLRRLCTKELGRTPMHHVAYMRMQHAQRLLETSRDKLEVIAPQVGYDSALVFSRVFKRWIGCSPTDYRARR